MPKLTVDGRSGDFEADKRLVLAIEELGIEIGHRCGGRARCTTCRVRFSQGEPDRMTQAEYDKLKERGLLGQARLSCQLTCSEDMALTVGMTKSSEGWTDTGPAPDERVQPEAVWFSRQGLEDI